MEAGIIFTVIIIVAAGAAGLWWVLSKPKISSSHTRQVEHQRSQPSLADARTVARGELPTARRTDLSSLSTPDLAQRARLALVESDDAIHTAEEEIGFAMAAYGDESVEQFQGHLKRAKESVLKAFRINQELEDSPEMPEAQKRSRYMEIIGHQQYVSEQLQAQEQWFDELRGLESQAEDGARRLEDEQLELETKIAQSQKAMERINEAYRGMSVEEVADNMQHLVTGQDHLAGKLAAAQQALAAGDRSGATLLLREGWDTASQMRNLAEGIIRKEQNLAVASDNIRAGMVASQQDLAEAEQILATSGGKHSKLRAPATALRQTLDEIEPALNQPRTDPEGLLDRLASAHAALDKELSTVRDYQQQRARAEGALSQAMSTADAKLQGAHDFITSRRGAVRYAARSKLLEAQQRLDNARRVQRQDPIAALDDAHQAAQLADQASRIAQADMEGSDGMTWGPTHMPYPPVGYPHRRRSYPGYRRRRW